MQSQYIIAGFTDIKSELRIKTRTEKSVAELGLWFTLHEDILYVHDANEHNISTALALHFPNENVWRLFLRSESYGERLLKYGIQQSSPGGLHVTLNGLYELHGFIPF